MLEDRILLVLRWMGIRLCLMDRIQWEMLAFCPRVGYGSFKLSER